MENDSRPSSPTVDLHTDAIILREGPGAVCSSYVRESSSSLAVAAPSSRGTAPSVYTPTPTASEPSPFMVRRTAFRAAPAVITVRPSPATERVRAREEAKARETARVKAGGRGRRVGETERGRGRARSTARSTERVPAWWMLVALFALGAVASALVQIATEKGGELAVLAAVVAGVVTLSALSRRALLTGKPRTRSADRG